MKGCIQRVDEASVTINDTESRKINKGIVVLLGIDKNDTLKDCKWLAEKISGLRIFPDENDKMSRSLLDINGEMLIVSQFTLSADCKKGKRPDFGNAMEPQGAKRLYNEFINQCINIMGKTKIATGEFGAKMKVFLVNNGPVTFLINT